MFTHAEFNRKGRPLCHGMIGRYGESGITGATLFLFACGDAAWWARGQFIAWPHRVHIWNRIGKDIYKYGFREQCALREAA